LGLLERIDVVQASGAAVYGSDAIAGVINYVLKKDFHGITVDAQGGETSEGDYPKFSTRLTAGTNFDSGKGNAAVDFEWNKTGSILPYDRQWVLNIPRNNANPYDTGPNDGIPASIPTYNPYFWARSFSGVVFGNSNTGSEANLLGYANPGHLTGYQFS